MHSVAFDPTPASAIRPSVRPSGGGDRAGADGPFADWLDQSAPKPASGSARESSESKADGAQTRPHGDNSQPLSDGPRPQSGETPSDEADQAVSGNAPTDEAVAPQAVPEAALTSAVAEHDAEAEDKQATPDADRKADEAAISVPQVVAAQEAPSASEQILDARPDRALDQPDDQNATGHASAETDPEVQIDPSIVVQSPAAALADQASDGETQAEPALIKLARPAMSDGPEGKIPAEGETDTPEDALALRSKAAPEEAKAAPEPRSRSIEPFAAVKAGVEAVQSLGQMSNQGAAQGAATVPTLQAHAPAAATIATPAPVVPFTAPPSMPVPMAGVGFEIAAQALAGNSRFEIRLDPPELGRVDVRLDIDKDGKVSTRLIVDRAETLDLLRRDAPQLERALQQAGLKTSDQPMQFSLRDQGGGHEGGQNSPSARHGLDSNDVPAEDIARPLRLLRIGGIDIRI